MNREVILKKAEKLLRDGKLGPAIEEYVRLVQEYPHDWSAVNALGDLYVRGSKPDLAIAQFTRIADHLFDEGFLPKAQAVYKKALRLDGSHEHTLRRLAEIATKQGLLADARFYQRRLGDVPSPEASSNAGTATPPAPEQQLPQPELNAASAGESGVTTAAAILDARAEKEPTAEISAERPAVAALLSPPPDAGAPDTDTVWAEAPVVDVTAVETAAVAPDPAIEEVSPAVHPAERNDVSVPTVEEQPVESVAMEALPLRPEPPPARGNAPGSVSVLEIDLSDVLNELETVESTAPIEERPKSLATVFAEMRSVATFGQQEVAASAHFQLAARHVEAARWDDAIAELEAAARAPALRFEAGSQLGRLLLSRGVIQDGIDWLERAIDAPAPDVDSRIALMYELAEALEQIDEWARALAILLEIAVEVPQYRDVDERVARLKRLIAGH